MNKLLGVFAITMFFSFNVAFGFDDRIDRAADEKAIREHIDKIFQAYIKKDRETVKATHSKNWRGFLSNSTKILRGIDAYMTEVDGQGALNKQNPGRIASYKMLDFDIVFYGDTGIVTYIAELTWNSPDWKGSYQLQSIDIYTKENGAWNQVASKIGPPPAKNNESDGDSNSALRPISAQMRSSMLKTRDEVWYAFFANDIAKLQKLIPKEIVAINPGQAKFDDHASIFRTAKSIAESGAKLVKLEFPTTEIQVYGSTVIMYSDYVYELDTKGRKQAYSGRATEIFVMRNNTLENVGWHLDAGK